MFYKDLIIGVIELKWMTWVRNVASVGEMG